MEEHTALCRAGGGNLVVKLFTKLVSRLITKKGMQTCCTKPGESPTVLRVTSK